MMDFNYTTLQHVLDSWEELKRVDNFEEKAGVVMYKQLFDLHPEVQILFGLSDSEVNSKNSAENKRFRMQARYMIQMLDTSLQMLGPDIELLTEINHELGMRHIRYGVTKSMYAFMGEALIFTLDMFLGDSFTKEKREAWEDIFCQLTKDILSVYPERKK